MKHLRDKDILNCRDREIYLLRFNGSTLGSIGKKYGLSKGRVRQVVKEQTCKVISHAKKRLSEGHSIYLVYLDFPPHTLKALLRGGIIATDQLWNKSKIDLLQIQGFGIKSWKFVRNLAHEHGYDHV